MKPETAGMSSARLARLDGIMKRRYVDTGHLPGMVTYVYRDGHLVHTGICGEMDIERGKKMREDAIFRIYSMSKPITAVALMMLVEEGLIGLDDAVHSYIPEWKELAVYASGMPSLLADAPPCFLTTPVQRPMKVVDLATHTSGLTYGFMMRTSVDAAYRRARIVDRQTPAGFRGWSMNWRKSRSISRRDSMELFGLDRCVGLSCREAVRLSLASSCARACLSRSV